MSSKFTNVPVDEDTKILAQYEVKFGDYPVLYQKWFWDVIAAESLIFVSEDIANVSLEELEKDVKESPLCNENSKVTIKKTEDGFTFVNFNFDMS